MPRWPEKNQAKDATLPKPRRGRPRREALYAEPEQSDRETGSVETDSLVPHCREDRVVLWLESLWWEMARDADVVEAASLFPVSNLQHLYLADPPSYYLDMNPFIKRESGFDVRHDLEWVIRLGSDYEEAVGTMRLLFPLLLPRMRQCVMV